MEYCQFCDYKTTRTDNMSRHYKTKVHQENLMKWKATPEGAERFQQIHFGDLERLEYKYLEAKMKIINACMDEEVIRNSKKELRRRLARVQYKNADNHRHVTCECGGSYSDIPTVKERHLQTRKHKDFVNKAK